MRNFGEKRLAIGVIERFIEAALDSFSLTARELIARCSGTKPTIKKVGPALNPDRDQSLGDTNDGHQRLPTD
jgi:hypothetical protein